MKVYLCGGINGLSDADCRDWRETAKGLLHGTLGNARHETLDPMRRDYRGKEDQNANDIVTNDLEDIRASDCVLVNAARPSWGTAMEVMYAALQRDKEIIAFCDLTKPVSPWLRVHCKLFGSLEAACAEIDSL